MVAIWLCKLNTQYFYNVYLQMGKVALKKYQYSAMWWRVHKRRFQIVKILRFHTELSWIYFCWETISGFGMPQLTQKVLWMKFLKQTFWLAFWFIFSINWAQSKSRTSLCVRRLCICLCHRNIPDCIWFFWYTWDKYYLTELQWWLALKKNIEI